MNPQRYICVALAALFVVACATDVPPALDNEIDLESVWAEAQAEVLVQTKAGGDSACQKVADDGIDEVKDGCKAAQKLVDGLPRGPHCCNKGVSLVTKAKQNLDNARKAASDCEGKLKKLRNTRVTFSNVKYRELKDGQCHRSFFSGRSYRDTKRAVEKQQKECSKRKGAIKAFKKAIEDAKKARDSLRARCRTNTRNNMNSMQGRATRLCNSAKNKKMWTRANHMICVLKKSTLAGCRIPSLPKIARPKLDFTMCSNGGEEQFSRRVHQFWTSWYGNWDGVANYNCPGTRVMNGQGSYHNNHREDRRWRIACTDIVSPSGFQKLSDRKSRGTYDVNVNGWNQNFNRPDLCGHNGLMVGAWSRHENRYEDRIFRFRCQRYTGIRLENKSWAGWCNRYDHQCNYQCPGNKVMIGVHSERSNGHRDRRFRYQCADVKFVQKAAKKAVAPKKAVGKSGTSKVVVKCRDVCANKKLVKDKMKADGNTKAGWVSRFAIQKHADGKRIPRPKYMVNVAYRLGPTPKKWWNRGGYNFFRSMKRFYPHGQYKLTEIHSVANGGIPKGTHIFYDFMPGKHHQDLSGETKALKDFLDTGARAVLVGENEGSARKENAYISKVVGALGGGVKVLKGAFSQPREVVNKLHGQYGSINKMPLTSGIKQFTVNYWAPLSVKMSVANVVMAQNNAQGNRIMVADQILRKGRVTVMADMNCFHGHGKGWQVDFPRNLAHQAARFMETVKAGRDPNQADKEKKKQEGACKC